MLSENLLTSKDITIISEFTKDVENNSFEEGLIALEKKVFLDKSIDYNKYEMFANSLK